MKMQVRHQKQMSHLICKSWRFWTWRAKRALLGLRRKLLARRKQDGARCATCIFNFHRGLLGTLRIAIYSEIDRCIICGFGGCVRTAAVQHARPRGQPRRSSIVEAYSQVGGTGRKLAVVDPSCLCSCGIVNARCGRRQKNSVSRQLKPQDHRSSASQLHHLQAVLAIARRAYGEEVARCTSCCTYTETYMHTYMRAYMNLSNPLPWTETHNSPTDDSQNICSRKNLG